MKFTDFLNEDKKKNDNVKEITVNIDTILKDLDGIYSDEKKMARFLGRINKPNNWKDRSKRFTYRINTDTERGETSILFNHEKSKSPSSDFQKIINAIVKPKPTEWEKLLKHGCGLLSNAEQQDFIRTYFIPKVRNPAETPSGKKTQIDDIVSKYRLFGKAMVFYAGKCVSKLTDPDTKIDKANFQEIMQGCFGAAPNEGGETEKYLDEFITLEPKMKIDAAKCTINSVVKNGESEDDSENESYYEALTSILPLLFEADEENNGQQDTFIKLPKSVDDFVKNNIPKALIQAKNVAQKYPKQYKIWYDKLEAAFNEGVEEQQELERSDDKQKFVNPITGKIEKRHGKAWGTGGPNGFIRDNPMLKSLVDDIKKGDPNAQASGGWTMFNAPAKIILGIFDALETGGKIYQKLCDDLGEGFKQIKHSIRNTKPSDFDALIKKYSKADQEQEAFSASIAGVICTLTNLYRIMGIGKIGTINVRRSSFNTENIDNTTLIQSKINEMLHSIELFMSENSNYRNWKEKKDKENEELIKKSEANLKKKKKKKNAASKTTSESTKPTIASILKEADEQVKKDSNLSDIENEIEKYKNELEKLGSNKKTRVNLDDYFVLLDGYAEAVSYDSDIRDTYQYLDVLFDADDAKEQYAKIFNKSNSNEQGEDDVVENTRLSIKIKTKLNEADDYSFEDDEDEKQAEKQETKQDSDKTEYSDKEGNLDWIENGTGESLKKLYDIFVNSPDKVHLDLSNVKRLATEKNQAEILNKLAETFKNLSNTLINVDIKPITDGIIAIDALEENHLALNQIPQAFKIVGQEETKKEEPKKETDEDPKNKKLTLKDRINQRDTLVSLINKNSKLMSGIVSKLNDNIKTAKDDSWLESYDKYKEECNNIIGEIFKKCYECYPEGQDWAKKGNEFIKSREAAIKNYTLIGKIWETVCLAKYIGGVLSKEIENKKTTKESFIVIPNGSVILENDESSDDENKSNKKQWNINTVKSAKEIIEKINFNELLPIDYTDELYNYSNANKFNDKEKHIAESELGTRGDNTKENKPKQVITAYSLSTESDSIIDTLKTKFKFKKLYDIIQGAPKSKGNKGDDRDVYFLAGTYYALCNILIAGLGNSEENVRMMPGNKFGNNDTLESYIPTLSKDSLINEIYKYIKG